MTRWWIGCGIVMVGLMAAQVFAQQAAPSSKPAAKPAEGDKSKTPDKPKAGEKGPNELDDLALRQSRMADKYARLEDLLSRMATFEGGSNPRRAALLKQALSQSKDRLTLAQLNKVVALLNQNTLDKALDGQGTVDKDLKALLDLLQSENRADRLKSEQARIKEYIKEVERLLRLEKGIQGQTEGGADQKQLSEEQQKIAERTQELAKRIQENEEGGVKKPAEDKDSKNDDSPPSEKKNDNQGNKKDGDKKDGDKSDKDKDPSKNPSDKKDDKKDGDKKDGDKKDSKSPDANKSNDKSNDQKSKPDGDPSKSDQKDGDKKDGEKKDGDKKDDKKNAANKDNKKDKKDPKKDKQDPKDDKKQDSPMKDGDPKDSQDSPPKDSKGPPKPGDQQDQKQQAKNQQDKQQDNPARKRIEAAEERMREAEKKLAEAKRKEAIEEQEKAKEELEKAKAALEEILRQMREEEIERTLAQLEGRFRKMLEMQLKVYESTKRLDKIAVKQRGEEVVILSGRLSSDERRIAFDADKALNLLREEGSSIALPETVEQMREDIEQVASRLDRTDVGSLTQNIEEDIIAALEEIIEALQKAQKDQENKKQQQQQQQQGQEQDQPLVDKIAELKMIRSLQMRVNNRTKRYSRLLDNEDDATGNATDADLRQALGKLGEREESIQRITRDIVLGKNK